MVIQFKNRKIELKEIERILKSDKFEFVIIYGRRRIGKTTLILEATKKCKKLYFLATEENNLERFYEVCRKNFSEVEKLRMDYETLFEFLKDKLEVIIIDEFQNMIKENKNIVSVFQVIVDNILANSKTKFFILGSSVSMLTSKVLSYQSPLYGRRTASLKLKKMKFKDIKGFFPKANIEELIRIYGFADGIPFYLGKIDPNKKFFSWLEEEIKKGVSFLRDEVDFLMRYEFEDVSMYKLILKALAFGKTTINEIKNYLNLKRTDITPYLRNLIETEFIERKVPITENVRSRKGKYFLTDNFLKFWFRFIYPNLSSIEEGTFEIEAIKREYPEYLGSVFENVCREFLIESKLFRFTKLGKWWHKDKEVDLVALNEQTKEILFCECKWKDKVNAKKICKGLVEKIPFLKWHNENRKESFVVFAKSFSKKINEFENRKVFCFDLKDLDKFLK